MQNILILGAGAIGLSLAAALDEAGQSVTLLSRSPFDSLIDTVGHVSKTHRVRLINEISDDLKFDWVFLCVKTHQVASLKDTLSRLDGPETRLAICQNGVEHRDLVAPYIPKASLLPVIVDIPSKRIAPGHINRQGRALLHVDDTGLGQDFCALFDQSFVTAMTDQDLKTRAWRKLCVNAPAGAILTLTQQTMHVFGSVAIQSLARQILKECIQVGRANGAALGDEVIETQMHAYMAAAPDEGNSMLFDQIEGRPTEWEARNNVICRKGRLYGIATPISDALVPLLKALSDANSPRAR